MSFRNFRHEGNATLECCIKRIDSASEHPVIVTCDLPLAGTVAKPKNKQCQFSIKMSDIQMVGEHNSAPWTISDFLFDHKFVGAYLSFKQNLP